MSELSARQRNRIFSNVEDKLVDKLCAQLIEGKTMSAHLKENLTTVINKVLSESENTSKISTTIFQSVNTSLQHVLDGPLLLYTLLEYDETFQQVETTITTVFGKVFVSSDKPPQTQLANFVNKLIGELQNPPIKLWFSIESTQQTGGNKRRVTRGRRKPIRKNTTRKQHGGLHGRVSSEKTDAAMVGGLSSEAGEAAAAMTEGLSPEAGEAAAAAMTEGLSPEAVSAMTEGLPPEAGEAAAAMTEGLSPEAGEAAAAMTEGLSPEAVSAMVEGLPPEAGQAVSAMTEGRSMLPMEGSRMDTESAQIPSSDAPEMSAHAENQMADDLLVKYETKLLESLSKKIPDESDKILQKVLNASYVYATANGDTILKSITDTLRETILNDPIMSPDGSGQGMSRYGSRQGMSRDISITISVIIIQSLFSAYKDVKQAILDVYNEMVEQSDPDAPPEFLPTSPEFITSFVGKLKENVGKMVRLE